MSFFQNTQNVSPAVVTNGDRARITHVVLTTILSHEAGAAMTNVAIRRLVRVSDYQVSKLRKTLRAMGTLGYIKGHCLPELPEVPDTPGARSVRRWRMPTIC